MTVYLTGLHSGTNPQPGLGTVRSLRAAFPDARFVGVDYSPRSSGIHWPELDDIWLQRPWEELNLPVFAKRIAGVLDEGGYWIAGTDLESRWLAQQFPEGHPRLLVPSSAALQALQKPAVSAAAAQLPVHVAPYLATATTADWELHAFCRAQDWDLWLKGPYYDAVRVRNWPALEGARQLLSGLWNTEELFVQRHVEGYEESVCFAAYEGELLGAVRMCKRDLTDLSKTWAGTVHAVPESFLKPLRAVLRNLRYTGGGELEMMRGMDDRLWLLEWNPRFPAWIYGATLAGTNLPALLLARASGIAARPVPQRSTSFTRVVLEVPVQPAYPLPPLPEPLPGVGFALKHPSGLLGLAKSMHGAAGTAATATIAEPPLPALPQDYLTDLEAAMQPVAECETPGFVFLPAVAAAGFQKTMEAVRRLSVPPLAVTPAYSIKTNPDERLLALAREAGFLAEAISLSEVRKALQCGFPASSIVLNGPGKWYPDSRFPKEPLHAVFADSLPDLQRLAEGLRSGGVQTQRIGIRLQPPHIPSRFGINIASPEAFEALLTALDALPQEVSLGLHMHMASSAIGTSRWMQLFESTLHWGRSVEALTGRSFDCLDLGGGWAPADWLDFIGKGLSQALASIQTHFPSVRQVLLEPGKAMAEPSMALAMRILEIRSGQRRAEAVVDASVADLPMGLLQPHRMVYQAAGSRRLQVLGRGNDQLQGRLCMEHDFAALHVALPPDAKAGDWLYACDAGAYDKSMAYDFGRG